jgi:hypothetical protein
MASFMGPRADPNAVLVQLMWEVGAEPCIQRIQLLGPKGAREDRLRIRAAIIHLTTAFHKTTAMVRIKGLLARQGLQQVVIEDCFPPPVRKRRPRGCGLTVPASRRPELSTGSGSSTGWGYRFCRWRTCLGTGMQITSPWLRQRRLLEGSRWRLWPLKGA